MKHILTILGMMMALGSYASEPFAADDSLSQLSDTTKQSIDKNQSVNKKSWMTRFLDYFNDANKNKNATDTKLGVGLVAAGLYRTDPTDSILPPSNVSLFGDVSTVGFYLLGVRGNHIFPKGKYRADYTLYFYSFPCKFWGMGYDMGDDDSNKSEMKRWQAQIEAVSSSV